MRKEEVLVILKILSPHILGGTEENLEKHQDNELLIRLLIASS
jgi:hypothetical protein